MLPDALPDALPGALPDALPDVPHVDEWSVPTGNVEGQHDLAAYKSASWTEQKVESNEEVTALIFSALGGRTQKNTLYAQNAAHLMRLQRIQVCCFVLKLVIHIPICFDPGGLRSVKMIK